MILLLYQILEMASIASYSFEIYFLDTLLT